MKKKDLTTIFINESYSESPKKIYPTNKIKKTISLKKSGASI